MVIRVAKTSVPRPDYSPREAAKRRDTALAAALQTRHAEHGEGPERKLKKPKAKKKR